MTFEEAKRLLKEKASSVVLDGQGLNREQELLLVEKLNDGNPVFVINWPKSIKPFYMRECLDDSNYVSRHLIIANINSCCTFEFNRSRLWIC